MLSDTEYQHGVVCTLSGAGLPGTESQLSYQLGDLETLNIPGSWFPNCIRGKRVPVQWVCIKVKEVS